MTYIKTRLLSLISWRAIITLSALYIFFRVVASILSTLRAQSIDISIEPDLFVLFTTLGLLSGWWLGMTRLGIWRVSAIATIGGISVVMVRMGQLGDELFNIVVGSISFIFITSWRVGQVVINSQSFVLPNSNIITEALQSIGVSVAVLSLRGVQWLVLLLSAHPSIDPAGAALVWGIIGWGLASWLTWNVRRHDAVVVAVAPMLILSGIISYYFNGDRENTPLILSASFSILLFLSIFNGHNERERFWKNTHIDYFDEVWRDLAMYAVPLAITLLLIVNLMPNNIVSDIVDRFNKMIRYRVETVAPASETGNGLGTGTGAGQAQPTPPPSIFEQVRSPGLPRSHLITARTEDLSKELVMYVTTSDTQTSNASVQRYYWRSITYDIYTGRGWLTEEPTEKDYEAGQTINDANKFLAQRAIRQNVERLQTVKGLMFETGTLISVDHNFRAAWRSDNDFYGATTDSESYRAVSIISAATSEQLRAAGGDYPPDIRERYLQLPDELPLRVRALARDLTATAPTPYDRAVAIEKYLRPYLYTLDLYAPPTNRDVVDYFLFDLQRGYCDYYATSMVVLARAAGLPARLVTGYASGKFDAATLRYVVTEADAHSWVEVYFPNYGWVEFEPTGGRAQIDREAEAVAPTDQNITQLMTGFRIASTSNWWIFPFSIVILLFTSFAAWLAADYIYLRRLPPLQTAITLYKRLRFGVQKLRVPTHEGDTPFEFAALVEKLNIQDSKFLIEYYVQMNYAPNAGEGYSHLTAIQKWNRVRWQLWQLRIKYRITRWLK